MQEPSSEHQRSSLLRCLLLIVDDLRLCLQWAVQTGAREQRYELRDLFADALQRILPTELLELEQAEPAVMHDSVIDRLLDQCLNVGRLSVHEIHEDDVLVVQITNPERARLASAWLGELPRVVHEVAVKVRVALLKSIIRRLELRLEHLRLRRNHVVANVAAERLLVHEELRIDVLASVLSFLVNS